MYKLVIFDLDGTLLNTLTDLANACNAALRACALEEHPTDAYKTYVGDGVYKLIERMVPKEYRNDNMIQHVKEIFDAHYAEHSLDHTKPYEGILELIISLRNQGIHCAVASNKPHEYTKELVKKMFGERIELAFGKRIDVPAKPNPAIVLEIIKHFNMQLEECLYVGDSDVDIYTAKNAGLTSVGVLWGYRTENELASAGAKYMVKNPKDLQQLILG